MARARNIKPGFFKNEILGTADPLYSLLFEGLWCLADREGRLEDRPLRIKAEVFPYRDGIEMESMLNWLQQNEFILRYESGGKRYIEITNFKKHQSPHKNEAASDIPAPQEADTNTEKLGTTPETLGTARADSLIPDSLIPDSLIAEENLVEDSAESHDDAKRPKWTDDDERLASEILARVRDVAPSSKGSRKWPDDIRLMRERDGRTHAEIRDMFIWANSDSFWRENILSPGKLREKWPQLEAKRNNAKARASPERPQTKQDLRADFWRQMNDGRNSETERIITGEAERVD